MQKKTDSNIHCIRLCLGDVADTSSTISFVLHRKTSCCYFILYRSAITGLKGRTILRFLTHNVKLISRELFNNLHSKAECLPHHGLIRINTYLIIAVLEMKILQHYFLNKLNFMDLVTKESIGKILDYLSMSLSCLHMPWFFTESH